MTAARRLASTRLATGWRAISRGIQAGDSGAAEAGILEALASVAGALAARLYYPAEVETLPVKTLPDKGAGGDFVAVADWCWALGDQEPRGLFLAAGMSGDGSAAEGLIVLERDELPFTHPSAWALLPLPHGGQVVAVVVLACPVVPQAPDAATREALVLAARQAGTQIAATRAQALLADAARFAAFHRSLTFATHDIKGISSQLSLLASNAERLGDNPDFRADMVLTLRAAAGRLDGLMDRLARGETAAPGGVADARAVDLGDIARAIAARLATRHQVSVIEREACAVRGDASAVTQVLTHLIENAVEASTPDAPVFVGINADGAMARLEVIDSGHGMSPQFLRERLFRPFDTSKQGGFGIGAYEAREMVRAMGGRLLVESREGVGTRFVIRLPLAVAAGRLPLAADSGPVAL